MWTGTNCYGPLTEMGRACKGALDGLVARYGARELQV
jgi:hypothetical protein